MKKKLTVTYYDIENNIAEELLSASEMKDGNFIIKDIPLFAPNLSLNDIVSVEKNNDKLFFNKLIKPSGNTTIHIILLKKYLTEIIQDIENHNGTIRKFHNNYLAVNFTSEKDYLALKNILEIYEHNEIISYRESCLGFL